MYSIKDSNTVRKFVFKVGYVVRPSKRLSMKAPRCLMQVVQVMVLSFIYTLKSVSWLFLELTIMYEVFE